MGLDKVLCARGAWDGLGPKMATNIIQYPMGHDNGTRNIFHLYPFISIIHIFSLQKTHTHRVELTQVEVPTQLLLELLELEESGLEEPSDGWLVQLVQLVHGTMAPWSWEANFPWAWDSRRSWLRSLPGGESAATALGKTWENWFQLRDW